MNTYTIRLSVVGVLTLLLLSATTFFVHAQEETQIGVETKADITQEASYNNSRSNRSTVKSPGDTSAKLETATAAQVKANLGTETNQPDALDDDSDGDGVDDLTTSATEDTDDCDDDESCVHPGENKRNRGNHPSRSVFTNSGSSERRTVTFGPNGFEYAKGTSLDVKFEQVATSVKQTNASNDGDDEEEKNVYCWNQAETESGQEYKWGKGLCVALAATENANGRAQERLAALQVRGDDIRSWSEEEKTAWREYRASQTTSTVQERLLERVIEKTQANERIREIEADDQGVGMSYRAEMRFLGAIPFQRVVTAQATADGDVSIDYPWYRFLSRVPEHTQIQNTLTELQSILMTEDLE